MRHASRVTVTIPPPPAPPPRASNRFFCAPACRSPALARDVRSVATEGGWRRQARGHEAGRVADACYVPGAAVAPLNVLPRTDRAFHTGRTLASPGEVAAVPPGMPHSPVPG